MSSVFTDIDIHSQQQIMVCPPEGYYSPNFAWNNQRVSNNIQLSCEHMVCQLVAGPGFKTVVGSEIFNAGGKYYFEVFINKGNMIKIGVCRPNVSLDQAFSDTQQGWAIYNGQLRHNSVCNGQKYGLQLKAGDILGVALDMINGQLSFYRNGQFWGIAFKDQQLKIGELVAAAAPLYSNTIFTLRSSIRED